jgi:hypothetical protein
MVNASALLTPVFIEIVLTFALIFWGGYLRVQAVRTKLVQPRDVSLGQPNWPPQTTKVMNAYHNQLELPLLFYLVVVLALTQLATIPAILVALAWVFVALRLAHAAIHVTTNDLTRRFFLFLAGAAVLALMWLIFIGRIYFGA